MKALERLFARGRASLAREPGEARLREEIDEHLALQTAANIAAGMPPEEARRQAAIKFGSIEALKEEYRDTRYLAPFERVLQDALHALRVLRRDPAFTALAVLILAVCIGATTTVFGVVNSVLLKPLPYADGDALVRIVHAIGRDQFYFSDAIYWTYVRNTQTFEDIGVWAPASTATITGNGSPEEVRTLTANRGLLTTLGVRPQLGRWFTKEEDSPGAPGAVILTDGYWRRSFGGDRSVLQRTLTIEGRAFQIVGVMPPGFRFDGDAELITPLQSNPARPLTFFRLVGIARLKPDVTLAQANADSGRILRLWLDESGQKDPAFQARYQPSLRLLKEDLIGGVRSTLSMLMGAVAIVMLLASANVATLLLVRADGRVREFAVRGAIGATWTVMARQLLVESGVLALLGGAAGIVLAAGALRLLVARGPASLPRLAEISLDARALGFALAVSIASGILFGLMPALRIWRLRLLGALSSQRAVSGAAARQRSQYLLIVVQMTLASSCS